MYCKIARLLCSFLFFCLVPLITMYIHVHIIIGCDFIWILLVDSLYAVYEASTLELWSFMMVSAFDARNYIIVAVYYTLLILFIVIILQVINVPVNCASLTIFSLFLPLQQSIFLVVIIESFADLRSTQSKVTSTNVKQQPTKPSVVNLCVYM